MILAEHPLGRAPDTLALVALMHFHSARIPARECANDDLLLLEEQDRTLWDVEQIEKGMQWLAESACGERFSRYHAEASIAAEHCLAPTFKETRWDKIVDCYALLEQTAPSALHRLNRAIALAEWHGAEEGLAVLEGFIPPNWLAGSYMWSAVLADLHRRCGRDDVASQYARQALDCAPTPAVNKLLRRRLRIRVHSAVR
jgi:RNA polymerase sigma-70 factor (ECF subfamily)